jgi:hypothetical protein
VLRNSLLCITEPVIISTGNGGDKMQIDAHMSQDAVLKESIDIYKGSVVE